MAEPRILIVYTSGEGHTASVVERVARQLRNGGASVDVTRASDSPPPAFNGYDGVVLGGSVHYGKFDGALAAYAREHATKSQGIPTAFFAVCLTAAVQDPKAQEDAHALTQAFLDSTQWDGDIVAIFGGAIAYRHYGFFKRQVMKRIAAKQGLETDTSRDWDHTDWQAVDHFADDVLAHVYAGVAGA